VTNASRTQLLNLKTLEWDAEILAAFDIPRAMLPQCGRAARFMERPHCQRFLACHRRNSGDQQAALVGQTCFGRVK